MDYIKLYEPLVGPLLTLILTAIVVPYLNRLYRLHREHALMVRKKLLEHTGVVIFGLFDGRLQSDYLGGFLTVMFGETLFDLIVGWNNGPSPNIIVPKSDYHSAHLEVNTLKKIVDQEVLPQYDSQDGYTWLETVREMGRDYFKGNQRGMVVLEIPI